MVSGRSMNLSALKTFLTVVALGNLNKAAERLNVTQSTVTARLDTLEEALGQRLLVRSRRGAALTKAGFAFQRHAELAVQSWEQALKAVGLPKGFSGIFSFACQGDLWDGAGAAWLEATAAEPARFGAGGLAGEPGRHQRMAFQRPGGSRLAVRSLDRAGDWPHRKSPASAWSRSRPGPGPRRPGTLLTSTSIWGRRYRRQHSWPGRVTTPPR